MEDGKRLDFTYLRLLEILPDSVGRKTANILCRLCGNVFVGRVSRVKNLEQKSCGCINGLQPKQDLTGQTINGVLFVGYEGKGLWRVKFSCGHEGVSSQSRALNLTTHNCFDCSRTEAGERMVHGHSPRSGSSETYETWSNMKRRCNDPKNNRYSDYGGRGIKVCDRWLNSFENFLEDMGERPEGKTLDRIELDGNYCKANCKWATDIEQANNKSNNRHFSSPEGEIWSLRRWCEIKGLDYKQCWHRLFKVNMSAEEVLGAGFQYIERTK